MRGKVRLARTAERGIESLQKAQWYLERLIELGD